MLGRERADVVGLSVIVPSYDFDKPGAKGEDLIPAVVPEGVGRKDPVLGIRHLRTVMGREPRGCWCDVRLPAEGTGVSGVSLLDRDTTARVRSLVVAVIGPCHPTYISYGVGV